MSRVFVSPLATPFHLLVSIFPIPSRYISIFRAPPPRYFSPSLNLGTPAMASSLTWTAEFLQPLPQQGSGDWCRYLAEIEEARDGYGHVAARMWSADGQLLAISRQMVTVFG